MFTTLVPASELALHLDDPDWIVFDCRHDLVDTEAGRRAYAQSHISGARFVHLDEDLSGTKTGSNGRHPLPDAQNFCARLATLGMRNDLQVVSYDASGGFYAARLWWMLRWIAHMRVAVLDGGWDGWLKSGAAVTSQSPIVHPASFNGSARDVAVDTRFVLDGLGKPDHIVIDARSPDRFRGENETLDPVGGHIPGARNRFFRNNLAADGRFKTATALRDEYTQLIGPTSPRGVVHQCGSGVTACHNLLAMEIAGFSGSKLYPGSWSAWCSNPQRPVAR